jgi:hypothetical protein
MIERIADLVEGSMDRWISVLSPFTSPTLLFFLWFAASSVALFLILRHQYKVYRIVWISEGLEAIIAGICGGLAVLAIYSVPVILFGMLLLLVVYGILMVFQFLAVASVEGFKR